MQIKQRVHNKKIWPGCGTGSKIISVKLLRYFTLFIIDIMRASIMLYWLLFPVFVIINIRGIMSFLSHSFWFIMSCNTEHKGLKLPSYVFLLLLTSIIIILESMPFVREAWPYCRYCCCSRSLWSRAASSGGSAGTMLRAGAAEKRFFMLQFIIDLLNRRCGCWQNGENPCIWGQSL